LKDHQKPIDQYLIKMIPYSGLHDTLRVQHVKNLVDHQNVFAHVLCYCLEEQNQNIWKNFFFKLLPQSAFSVDRTVSSSRSVVTFFGKCVDSMEIITPNQNQLDYYFCNDYFSNTNDASPAVEAAVPAGGGEVVVKQTSKMISSKRTAGSLGNKKKRQTRRI
jgi:hypothetical protein